MYRASVDLGLQARTVPGAVEGIRDALEWSGLEYDHGQSAPASDPGPSSPFDYRSWEARSSWAILPGVYITLAKLRLLIVLQSERLDLYHSYANKLLDVCPTLLPRVYAQPDEVCPVRPCVPLFLLPGQAHSNARETRTHGIELYLRQDVLAFDGGGGCSQSPCRGEVRCQAERE